MSRIFKQLLLALFEAFALTLVVHAQDQSGFISIDCGQPKSSKYTEETTGIEYISDSIFIDTGETKFVSVTYRPYISQQYWYVRSFPEGIRNCYTINVTNGNKYLIRTTFVYGNYDGLNSLPEFELHLGPNFWVLVKVEDPSTGVAKEIIYVPLQNFIHICLVAKGSGVPFISAIELRSLPNERYLTLTGSPLELQVRYDTGRTGNIVYRYPEDVLDRFWLPYRREDWTRINTSSVISNNLNDNYQLPSNVMRTAAIPKDNTSHFLNISWMSTDKNAEFYVYAHFAELEEFRSRQLYITRDTESATRFIPQYLHAFTLSNTLGFRGKEYNISISTAPDSSLQPILNAFEVYKAKSFVEPETNQEDSSAINSIKFGYKIKRNWQGDPCGPQVYLWEGLKCSHHATDPPRIISLDLSSSELSGHIHPSIFNLTMIQTLDLSNNRLTGPIPDFLSNLQNLNILNLEKNKFTGSVPIGLIQRRNNALLLLSLCENPNLSAQESCKTKKHKFKLLIPVVLSIIGISFLAAATIWWCLKSKRQHVSEDSTVEADNRPVPEVRQEQPPPHAPNYGLALADERFHVKAGKGTMYSFYDIMTITSNLECEIGNGGFGKVYYGTLEDGRQVAVKILDHLPGHGPAVFINEVRQLMRVNQENLVSIIGYCYDGGETSHPPTMALVLEFVSNGNLQQHLFGKNKLLVNGVIGNCLTWKVRLQIAIGTTNGLNYLHNKCNPAIVHRDLKAPNILLNESFQAKIADFGICKVLPTDASHVTTGAKGTPGYFDPEYFNTQQLTKKSDIYSFGIVLLELITGKPAIIKEFGSPFINVSTWVSSELQRNDDIQSIVDSGLQGTYTHTSARKAIEIAMKCLAEAGSKRPEISAVHSELMQCLDIERACEQATTTESIYRTTSMQLNSNDHSR